ncbi:hypothetical protein Peur_060836 [Populus x canadensis]
MIYVVLENFCGRVKCKFLNNYELVEFLAGYKRGRPGDGVKSCCMLLSRCLRRPFRKTFFYSY